MSFNLATILTETALATPDAPVYLFGGASLSEDIMRTFEAKYGIEVLEGYGMSETASSCSFRRGGTELSADEVIAYCRERLAAYKCPREIRFMAELPKGPSGKILKSALRAGNG
jgi:acyl-CoA synthetase (AMP-forming)/AMP-acid ligase II